jgi:Mitochondrial protein Pet127
MKASLNSTASDLRRRGQPLFVPVSTVVAKTDFRSKEEQRLALLLAQHYNEEDYDNVVPKINQIIPYRGSGQNTVQDTTVKEILLKLGIVGSPRVKSADRLKSSSLPSAEAEYQKMLHPHQAENTSERDQSSQMENEREDFVEAQEQSPENIAWTPAGRNFEDAREDADDHGAPTPPLDPAASQSLTTQDAILKPLDFGKVNVPRLSFDLSRVLFNPGVYQLQDPRSRVYNFDPYLQNIMPVSEFNFDALNQYVTSSEDNYLRNLALERAKHYIGSSSSMSSALSHFHYLLSSWRRISVDSLSKGFDVDNTSFTKIHKAPSAIFLRWRDGVYAVDADKEFDSGNILMSLGRSMEKLLTLEKDEYEQYRKSTAQDQAAGDSNPEQYHYGELGKFLLRSQLDAHDPRLPGPGMFDLKTRAVVSVRMTLKEHEKGLGYQIKERHGTWESYEREFYDMIRSAFLKYSLQVRMGRMDGVFVTYHNVENIFGFQYIALPEMDLALHGQADRSLGDREFGFSVQLMSHIFDRVTQVFPEQSIRFHFDTRESAAKVREQVHRMYIFAEPMSEEKIKEIQQRNHEEIKAYEEKLRNPLEPSLESGGTIEDLSELTPGLQARPETGAANVEFLESGEYLNLDAVAETTKSASSSETATELPPVLGFELVIRNVVNGTAVTRPMNLTAKDEWTLEYSLTPMKEAEAQAKYTACKNRRKTALSIDRGEQELTMNSFFRNLVRMSEEGAKWRRQQDELDARKEQVVLYRDRYSKTQSAHGRPRQSHDGGETCKVM